ncbi:MAG: MurR/RpiR family transcriptional regulator [Nocardioides sp.]
MGQAAMRIDERIARHRSTLSPQERRAADTLLDHIDDLATYRAAELANLAGVSKATMSRLFRSLGFADFDEVRDHLRGLRHAGEPRPSDTDSDLSSHHGAETEAITRALASDHLGEAVGLLAGARRVLVVGWRNSYPVALHLREQLIQARPAVTVGPTPGQVIGEELADLGAGDVVVAIGFRRRPAGFAAFVAAARATGADVVLISDPTGMAYLNEATVWLECPLSGALAFDSYAAAMSVVTVLADGVLRQAVGGSERISAISTTYETLGEIE